jgi:hypothetical protein
MHDYISVDFGQGQVFTVSFRGSKGTNLSSEVFTRLDDFVQAELKKPEGNYGKAIKALVENIDCIWTDWNKPMPTFAAGDRVIGPNGVQGIVKKRARTNYEVQFDGDRFVISISPTLIRKA